MAKELNIIDRGATKTEWDASKGVIKPADLDKIGENQTDNSGALNALPTPFARMHVFKEAFRRVKRDGKGAGVAYTSLVSDCLDLFELLFNYEYHKKRGDEIVIKVWNESDFDKLEKTLPTLWKSLKSYKDEVTSKMYFISYIKNNIEYFLGGSSPYTFFVTPPDLDKKRKGVFYSERYQGFDLKKEDNKTSYFKDIKLIDERSENFQKYLFDIFDGFKETDCIEIRDYVTSSNSLKGKEIILELNSILDIDNDPLIINGKEIKNNCSLDTINYFNNRIIKLPYKINSSKFLVPVYERVKDEEKRNADYLMPLSEDALKIIDFNSSDWEFIYNIKNASVVFKLKYKGKEFKQKEYYAKADGAPETSAGLIVDLVGSHKINFNMGIFPFVKSDKIEYNDYYKVMAVIQDENVRKITNNQFNCRYYKSRNGEPGFEEISQVGSKYGTKRSDRTIVSENTKGVGTSFFELFDSSFDLLNISFSIEGEVSSGIIIPKFQPTESYAKSYTYAIDLGTTNTFVSYKETNSEGRKSKPFSCKVENQQMVMLHTKDTNVQNAEIERIERNDSFKDSVNVFRSEFVPSYIDGNCMYKFPIRTALVCKKNKEKQIRLFDQANIAFAYEKQPLTNQNEVNTNLKWDDSNMNQITLFIREILYIIRTNILLEGGNPSLTKIQWFKPISFSTSLSQKYESVWVTETEKILKIPKGNVVNYTESEVPYYHYSTKDEIKKLTSVAVIDIGGGSTDMVLFEKNIPQFATSVHFGCNVLWENGYSLGGDRVNGIYKNAKIEVEETIDDVFRSLYDDFENDELKTTSDILNFWISNKSQTKIDLILQNQKYKLVFLYHYTAIIFHFSQIMKNEGRSYPTAFIFSGNGSRYIDFMSKDASLNNVTDCIVSYVYGVKEHDIQLILPDEERKEATCYGGLCKDNDIDPKKVSYLGLPIGVSQSYENLFAIKEAYDNNDLKKKIEDNITDFIDCYKKIINDCDILEAWGIENKGINKIIQELKNDVIPDLDKGYTEKIKKLDNDSRLSDSMFFLPIVRQIFNLSKKI